MKLSFPLRQPRKVQMPATVKQAHAPYWALVKQHGQTRKSAAAFIAGIGGYIDRHDRFALEFNISAAGADLSFENLTKMLESGNFYDQPLPEDATHRAIYLRAFGEAHAELEKDLFWQATEDAYSGWAESGSAHELWCDVSVDWDFERHGRCSKHLCVTSFEGENMKFDADFIEEWLLARPDDFRVGDPRYARKEEFVAKLFLFCVHMHVLFGKTNFVDSEVEYQALHAVARHADIEAKTRIEAYDAREELRPAVTQIKAMLQSDETLANAFRSICSFAGVEYK